MSPRLRPILTLASLACFLLLVGAGVTSYRWTVDTTYVGDSQLSLALHRGTAWLRWTTEGLFTHNRSSVEVYDPAPNHLAAATEGSSLLGFGGVRQTYPVPTNGIRFPVWFPALLFAIPPALWWWRRRGEGARGFTVVAGGGKE